MRKSRVASELKFARSSTPHKIHKNKDLTDKTRCTVYDYNLVGPNDY